MNDSLKRLFNSNLNEYKSIPFWSWNNHLDEKVLIKQIEEMYDAGIGGFIMHARIGLKDEYLGEKWFSCIEACLDKAKELGMAAWVYDENGWPSGFVGGKLLEKEAYRARFLEYSVGEWQEAFASYVEDEKLGFQRVTAPVAGVKEYHHVFLRISPANTDILNPDVIDAFIEETHEEYYRRYADRFGKELVGFFTDEPQYYRWGTPYTPCAEPVFAKDGEDIRDGLIWLFKHDKRGYAFRTKYFHTLSNLYVTNFYKKLYDWCESHNCKLTGHSVDENRLYSQMWGGAAVSPSYEYEHIPGIDALGRWCLDEIACKQVASVSAQLGKKQILTETFGCSGNDVTPTELKGLAEAQYFMGVNLMCQHLYPYSIAGQGKVDHPPVFGPHGNWGNGFKVFNDYFTHLGAMIVNTKECVDVAILHPLRDIWLEYVRAEDYQSVKDIEEEYQKLLQDLRKHGVTLHFLDEEILCRYGKVEKGILKVGEESYSTVIVPKMYSIAESSYRLLKKYDGKLCVLGAPQYIDGKKAEIALSSNITLDEIKANAEVKYFCADCGSIMTHRKGEIGEFIFVKNITKDKSHVSLPNVSSSYLRLDLETMSEFEICDECDLAPDEGLILVKNEKAKPKMVVEEKLDITNNFTVTNITENYLVLDYGQIARKGENFGKRYPIYGLCEELLREDYKGEVSVRHTFTLAEKMPLKLIMEKTLLKSATVNGKSVAFTQNDFDVNFVEVEIGALCKEGENEFIYTFDFWQHEGVHFALFDPMATESLRNCLYYDTTVEPVYLQGDFTVNADMVVSKRRKLPSVTNELYKQGYPFFKGELTLEGSFAWQGEGRVILHLDGRFMMAEMQINGAEAAMVLDSKQDITKCLQKGENTVKIVLRSSLRNLFGPHHFKPVPEPMGVSPYNFVFRGHWGEGYPADYTDTYNSVPFGVKEIYCTLEK